MKIMAEKSYTSMGKGMPKTSWELYGYIPLQNNLAFPVVFLKIS